MRNVFCPVLYCKRLGYYCDKAKRKVCGNVKMRQRKVSAILYLPNTVCRNRRPANLRNSTLSGFRIHALHAAYAGREAKRVMTDEGLGCVKEVAGGYTNVSIT